MRAGASAVAVVTMPDDFPDGWDVADPLPAGWTVEMIRAKIEAVPFRGPPTQPTPPAPEVEDFERCAPSFTLPTATIDEAADELMAAMDKVFTGYLPGFTAERHRYVIDKAIAAATGAPEPVAPIPRQIGIASDMAVGKTQTAIVLSLASIARHPDIRILYAVPNHVTGEDFVSRINAAAGREIARRWSGLDRPDPEHEGKSMCWRDKEVKAATGAGGTVSSVCGSAKRDVYCPFHEKGTDGGVCGMRRQAIAAVADRHIQVWVVPHAMINRALPSALRRPKLKVEADGRDIDVTVDAFDLVLLDEAPWPNMFGGVGPHPYTMPMDDLMRPLDGFWEVPALPGESSTFAANRLSFLMTTAHSLLSDNPNGWLVRGHLRPGRAELTATMCKEARALTYRLMRPVDEAIDPEDVGGTEDAIKEIAAHNREVLKMARLWGLLALVTELECDDDCSPYIRLETKDGVRRIVMAWKDTIHESLLAVPLLYLDGTMNATIASSWLERLDVVADIKAKTPDCVRRVQVGDRAIGHSMISPNPKANAETQTTQRNNVAKLARRMELLKARFAGQGKPNDDNEIIDVAAIVPMATQTAIETGFDTGKPLVDIPMLHWQNQRGSNKLRAVRCLQLTGRTLPAPAVPEMLAWLSTGKVGECIPAKDFYPQREAGFMMRDGTGRKVLQRYHPDPTAEAWRWQLCEGELLQGEARGRAKRRDDDSPLLVEIITNVPLPLEIDEVVTADSLLGEANPLAMMITRGAVFEDWVGIGQACADMFPGANDKGIAAKKWFGRNRVLQDQLRDITTRECVPNPIIEDIYIGFGTDSRSTARPFARYRYRRAGERKGAYVHVQSDIANPLAHVEAIVGPVDRWAQAPVKAAPAAHPDQPPQQTETTAPEPAGIEPDETLLQEQDAEDAETVEGEDMEIVEATAAGTMAGLDTEGGLAAAIQLMRGVAAAHARLPIVEAWIDDEGGPPGLSLGDQVTRAIEEFDRLQRVW